jgi:MscS family membrane protein
MKDSGIPLPAFFSNIINSESFGTRSRITFQKCHFWKVFLLLLFFNLPLKAQLTPGQQENEQEVEETWPEDPLGRRTPRSSIAGFISAVADKNYARASSYLDLQNLPPESETGVDLARSLELLLDQQGHILPYSWISDEPGGRKEDGLPPNLDNIGSIHAEDDDIRLYIEETKGPDGGPIWLISSESLEKIATLSTSEVTMPIDRILPGFLENKQWGGVPVGQWLATLLLAALSYFIAWSIISLLVHLIPLLSKKAREEPFSGVIKAFALPLKLYLAVWLFVVFIQEMGISIIVRQKISGFTVIIGWVAFLILVWQLAEFIGAYSKRRMMERESVSGVSVVLFLRRAARIAIVVIGIIAILGALGVDVTTGLAALGIGGLALALGAQKTIENFVGSVTLITDQPIRVGDFCRVGDTMGTVEKIGMRSTRIRTLDRTLITVPNGEFSSSKIENYAFRDRFWFHPVLGLRYETTPDQIRYLLVELRKVLYAHPLVSPDPARVRFVELGADSLKLDIFAYINVTNFDDFLEVKEDLLLRMMDIVGESGTGFAFPSQTLYFAKDQGLSKDRAQSAEEKVKQWREKEEMQIPKFDPEEIEKLKDTGDYPPKGSTMRKNSGGGKIPGL